MKVYTVDHNLKLDVFASGAAFLRQAGPGGWCSDKYLRVVPTTDLKELYSEPSEKRGALGVCIPKSDDQIAAHNILHGVFMGCKK